MSNKSKQMSTSTILRTVAEIPVSAFTYFDSREECIAGYEGKSRKELKVSWFQPALYEHYLGVVFRSLKGSKKKVKKQLKYWLIEREVPQRTIVVAKLLVEARDPAVIAAINNGRKDAHVIHFAHYFQVLNRQPNGEYRRGKALRVNHFNNIGYCRDRNGKVRNVSSDFFKPGWSIATDPVEKRVRNEKLAINRHGSWRVGDYVLYYK